MKLNLLKYLNCLSCHGDLQLSKYDSENEIVNGNLQCKNCKKIYEILHGVPIFVNDHLNNNHQIKLTAQNFAYSWHKFPTTYKDFYKKQFFDWISPINEESLNGKFVLDAGCGKGHHLMMISPYVKEAIGVDIGNSVFAVQTNTKHLPNIHVIKADLNNLPLKDEIFDYIYSIGVIHHTESPKLTTQSLNKKLKPGGQFSIWVYGRENNWWIIYFVNPYRKFISKYFHPKIIHLISILPALILYPFLKLIYQPVSKHKILKPLRKLLFYYPYLSYISNFDFGEINNIAFDHLLAPISYYLNKEEVKDLINFDHTQARIEWHNQNSWRVLLSK